MGFFISTEKLLVAVTIKHITFGGFMVIMQTNCWLTKQAALKHKGECVRLSRRWLLLPFVLIVLVSLLAHAPSRVLQSSLPASFQSERWGGSIFNGQVVGRYQQFPAYIDWNWRISGLFTLSLAGDLRVRSTLTADLNLNRGPLSWSIDAPLVALAAGAVPGLPAGFIMPAWRGSNIQVSRAYSGEWKKASGRLLTAGGPMRLVLQGQVQEVSLPAAVIELSLREKDLVADMKTDSGEALATMTLTADHRVQWQLRDRLLRLKPGYVSQNDLDLIVLTVAEPL